MRRRRWVAVLHGRTGPLIVAARFHTRRGAQRYAWRHTTTGHAYSVHRASADLPGVHQ